MEFLLIDLELGFTFAGVAKTELEMRDVEGFNQAKGKALKVVRMVEHLRGRLPEESVYWASLRSVSALALPNLMASERPVPGTEKTVCGASLSRV